MYMWVSAGAADESEGQGLVKENCSRATGAQARERLRRWWETARAYSGA